MKTEHGSDLELHHDACERKSDKTINSIVDYFTYILYSLTNGGTWDPREGSKSKAKKDISGGGVSTLSGSLAVPEAY
jgi:hypothetical protein